MSGLLPLFYLLLLLLPVQLGKHFFLEFSQIVGIRSDYLAPTFFLTDLLIAVFVSASLYLFLKDIAIKLAHKKQILQSNKTITLSLVILFLALCVTFFTSIFIALNPLAALYKWVKIVEFLLLGFFIVRLKPKPLSVLFVLSLSVVYISFIALWQFALQQSVGGPLWWLGERTFSASTPGIAYTTVSGRTFLRAYSIFPHPNVLGGFLAVVLPLIVFALRVNDRRFHTRFKLWFRFVFAVGLLTLIFTFSKAAWIMTTVGILAALWCSAGNNLNRPKKYANQIVLGFISLFILSIFVPFILDKNMYIPFDNVKERIEGIGAGIQIFSTSPMFGVGLNNFVMYFHKFISQYTGLFIFQPVHNIYLLLLVETGLVGFVLFMFCLLSLYKKSFTASPFAYIGLTQIFLLGFFDHYLFTLQQGQLLFVVFAALGLYTVSSKDTV